MSSTWRHGMATRPRGDASSNSRECLAVRRPNGSMSTIGPSMRATAFHEGWVMEAEEAAFSWHLRRVARNVCFTSDSDRLGASQRNDAMCQQATWIRCRQRLWEPTTIVYIGGDMPKAVIHTFNA